MRKAWDSPNCLSDTCALVLIISVGIVVVVGLFVPFFVCAWLVGNRQTETEDESPEHIRESLSETESIVPRPSQSNGDEF